MKKYLLILASICISVIALAVGGNTINIKSGTIVSGKGTVRAIVAATTFVNNGTYIDSTGTLTALAGITFSGSGTTMLNNLVINHASGSSSFNSQVSVRNTATITSGTVSTGANKLYLRTDINPSANLVNNGVLTGTVDGLVTNATITSGGCPSYTSVLSHNVSGSVMVYQWQSSNDSSSWTNITGATNVTYTATVTATTFYRCNLTTSNSVYSQATPGKKLNLSGSSPTAITGMFSVCPSATTILSSTPTGGVWSSSNTAVGTIGSASGVLTGVTAGTTTITYNTGCGTPVTQDVTVNPAPVMTVTPTAQTLCNNSNSTLQSFSSNVSGTTYTWANNNTAIGIGASGSGSAIASFTATNTGSSSISGVFTVTPTAAGCVGSVQTFTITVSPTPVMTVTPTAQTICNNATTSTQVFSSNVTGTTYTWNNSNTSIGIGASGSGSSIAAFTATNSGASATSGVFTVTPTAAGCVGSVQTFTVTVSPTPVLTVTPTAQTICNNTTTSTQVFSSNVTGTSYTWINSNTSIGTGASGSGSSIASFTATNSGASATSGVFTVTPTAASCLGAAKTFTITVNPTPIMTVTPTAQTVCNGINTSSEMFSSNVTGTSYTWENNNTSIGIGASGSGSSIAAFTATNTGAIATNGVFTVTPTANGCVGPVQSFIITVSPSPNPGSISGTASFFTGDSSMFTASGATGGIWSSSNTAVGTVSTSGVVMGLTAGTTIISYTVTNSCGSASATKTVTVNASLETPITGTLTVCVGNTTNLSNATSGGGWSSSNTAKATIDAGGVVTGISAGTSIISYTLSGTSVTAIVTVNALADAGTLSSSSPSLCIGGTSTVTSNGTSGGTWTSTNTGVGSVDASTGVITGISAGTTTISYSVSTGCGTDVSTRVFTVNPLPNAGAITGASSVNDGASITLANATTGGAWSSSTPSIATIGSTGVVTGVSAGTVTISYTVTNSCGSASATKTVTVNAVLETSITGTLTVCVGSTTTLSNVTGGGVWSSSNTLKAVVNTEGVVTGINAGTTVISYTLLGTSVTAIVTVNALPVSGTLSGATSVCIGSTATVSKTGTGGEWSSSVPEIATIGTTGIVSGLTAGTTTISYTVSNDCGIVAATRVVTVTPLPYAGAISGASPICQATTTALTNTVSGGTWSSNYPAGATVNGSTGLVTAVAAGAVIISYRMTNSCGTSYATFPISIINAPSLGVISGATTVCESSTTTLTNTTAGGTWSSTNTGAATINASTGAATGVAAGTTTISYNVTNICGSATVSRTLTVNPLPVAAFISGTTTLSAGTTTTLTATPSGGTWLSASGTIASINTSGVVTGVAPGIATISYTRTNSCGSVVTTVVVTVTGAITPITGTRVVCQGATTNLANATAGGTWSTADGAIATIGTTGVVTGVGAGTTTVTYTFSGGGNVTATVTVNAAPAAYTGSGIICSGSQLNLGSIIPGCTWTSGTTTRATVGPTTGIVTGGSSLGTVNISYTSAGCRTITQLTVTAGVALITGVASPCVGSSITLANATSGGTWSSSNTDRVTIDATSGLLTAISSGTVTISYSLSAGCVRTTTVIVGTPPAITGNPSVCVGQQNLLTSSGGTWSSSNVSIASVAASGFVTGVSLGNAVITYRSTANTLCFVTQAVTVSPLPSAIVAPAALCPSQTATLTSTPSGGTWTSSFPTKVSVDPTTGVITAVIFNYSTISAVNIFYTLPTGCGAITTVSVNPIPSPIGGGSRNICVAGSTTLTNSTSGGVWSSANPAIATAAAGGIVTGVSGGLATISYTNALGCANTEVVTVNAMPGANTGAATLCLPGVTTTLSNPAGAGTWTSSNNAKATVNFSSGVVTGVNTGTANITYSKAAGCISVTQVTVSVCAPRPGMTEDKEGDNSVFTVSPNPTTGIINLTTDVVGKVVIYTIDGKLVQQYETKAGTTSMSLPAGLTSGIYMLRFTGADGSSKIVRLVYQQ